MELVLAVLLVLGLFIIWFRSLNYRRFNLLPGGDGHGAGDVAAPGSLRNGR